MTKRKITIHTKNSITKGIVILSKNIINIGPAKRLSMFISVIINMINRKKLKVQLSATSTFRWIPGVSYKNIQFQFTAVFKALTPSPLGIIMDTFSLCLLSFIQIIFMVYTTSGLCAKATSTFFNFISVTRTMIPLNHYIIISYTH